MNFDVSLWFINFIRALEHNIMKKATKRSILRWIHLVFSIPIIGYVYGPFEKFRSMPLDSVRLLPTLPYGIVDVERPSNSTTFSSGSAVAAGEA